jgi:putative zinc finger protein
MTADDHRRWREELGAFVLDQLDPDERAAVQAHLDGCAQCREERDLLLPLAEILPLADPAWLTSSPVAPRRLGRSIARKIDAERRGQRRRRLQLGAGIATATAALAAVFLLALGGGPSAPHTEVAFADVPAGVHITGDLTSRSWGTEVSVYVDGIRPGTRCRVFLRGPNGRVQAGTFRYDHADGVGSGLSAAIDLSRARAIGIRAGDRTFVAPIPPPASA